MRIIRFGICSLLIVLGLQEIKAFDRIAMIYKITGWKGGDLDASDRDGFVFWLSGEA
jgi:hypothetical protein